MKKNWKFVFKNFLKDKKVSKNYSQKNLLFYSGHISKTGKFTLKKWKSEIMKIEKKVLVKKGKLLEIGCGPGSLLKSFEKKMEVYGVDYSKPLISVAKKAIPKGKFFYLEASKINFKKNFFDSVILFSCIQYFSNKSYLKKVLKKIQYCLKKKGNLYIGEIIDKNKMGYFKKYRIKELGLSTYKKLYMGKENSKLQHLAFTKKEMAQILKKDFYDHSYSNSIKRGNEKLFFRYNLHCKKK